MALPGVGGPSPRLRAEAIVLTDFVETLFVHPTRGRISSSPLLADGDGDGWPEIYVGGERLHGLSWDGDPLPRWPRRGSRPFASSPAFGDIQGDGRGEIVVGCDDGRIYALHADGDLVAGWPLATAADVFSTPALADLDGDGASEIVVGSDDSCMRALRGDGSSMWTAPIPGRPFVSASATVGPFDRDGRLGVAVGAWDRGLHVWAADGTGHRRIGDAAHVVWSSAASVNLGTGGCHLVWAADRLRVTSASRPVASPWSRVTASWIVSSPAVAELRPGDGPSIVVGSERLYAWDFRGKPRPGWPVDVGDFLWSSPIAFDLDGDGAREVVVGSWDGGIHALRPDGRPVPGFPLPTGGPVFSTPAAAPLPRGGGLLVAASWDGTVRGWTLPKARFRPGDWAQFRGSADRRGAQPERFGPVEVPAEPEPEAAGAFALGGARIEDWNGLRRVVLSGSNLEVARRLELVYEIAGEGRRHPVPFVNSRGRFVALVQPLRIPRFLRFHVEAEGVRGPAARWPSEGAARAWTGGGGALARAFPRVRTAMDPA